MNMTNTKKPTPLVNGIDVAALTEVIGQINADPSNGVVAFSVKSAWKGQTLSEHRVDSFVVGGTKVPRSFTMQIDEPLELLGQNTAANPQEVLMSALNACVMVGYVAGAAVRGIELESLELETAGELDLRGFLGLDPNVRPGYESLRYTVKIKGNGTPEQFQEIHENVLRTSPNYFNITKPVRIDATLKVIA